MQHEPSGPSAADQPAFAEALNDKRAALSGMTDGRGRSAEDRFRVYRNNVIVSLAEALEASFPTTRRLVGETFFRSAAVAYAETTKPSSPLLFRYGGSFPDFLAGLPGLSNYPFVPEAARIEYARIQAYHAADAEPLAHDALARLAPDALPDAVLTGHPAAFLVHAPSGGVSAWRENQTPPQARVPADACLVTRPALDVMVTPLDTPTARLANGLLMGRPLGEAAALEELDLASALATLLSAGAFQSVCVAVPS